MDRAVRIGLEGCDEVLSYVCNDRVTIGGALLFDESVEVLVGNGHGVPVKPKAGRKIEGKVTNGVLGAARNARYRGYGDGRG